MQQQVCHLLRLEELDVPLVLLPHGAAPISAPLLLRRKHNSDTHHLCAPNTPICTPNAYLIVIAPHSVASHGPRPLFAHVPTHTTVLYESRVDHVAGCCTAGPGSRDATLLELLCHVPLQARDA